MTGSRRIWALIGGASVLLLGIGIPAAIVQTSAASTSLLAPGSTSTVGCSTTWLSSKALSGSSVTYNCAVNSGLDKPDSATYRLLSGQKATLDCSPNTLTGTRLNGLLIRVVCGTGGGTTTTVSGTTTTIPATTTTTQPITTTTTQPITTTTTTGGGGYHPAGPLNMTSCTGLDQSTGCKWPGPTNTGVPAGTTLTKLTAANVPETATCKTNNLSGGQLTITCANTKIDAMDIEEANVFVSAPGVVFTRDLIQTHSAGESDSNVVLVDYDNSSAYLTVMDSTLNGYGYLGNNYHVIAYGQYSLVRDNVEGGTDAVLYDNGDTNIQDSWLHGINSCEAYMNPTGPDSSCGIHADVVQKSEGNNDALIHNTLQTTTNDITSGIQCCTDQGSVANWTVQNNLFLTGGWQMYGGYPGQNAMSNVVYTGNHFTTGQNGEKGYVVYANEPGVITWSGNVNDTTGAAISN